MKPLILAGSSQNNVLTRMALQLADGFREIGVAADTVSLSREGAAAQLSATLAATGADTVIVFNAANCDLKGPDGRSVYDTHGVRFIGWMVDHPCYHHARLTAPIADRLTVVPAPHHFAFLDYMGVSGRRLLLAPGVPAVHPPGKPFAARPVPLLMAATWMGEPERWWDAAKGTPVAAIAEGVVTRLEEDPAANVGAAWSGTLAALGYDLPFSGELATILSEAVTYVRRRDRLRLLQALIDQDLPVALCGEGWAPFLAGKRAIPILPGLDFDQLAEIHESCKVVVNLNAGNGGGERALSALSAGAAAVSDYSPFLDGAFAPEALRFYDRAQVEVSVGMIGDLIESDAAERMGEEGLRRIEAGHLWRHRAQALIAS